MSQQRRQSSSSDTRGLLSAALDLLRNAANGAPYANQAELARAANVSEANISRWLSGSSTPTLKHLDPVLRALGARLVLPETPAYTAPIPPPIYLNIPDSPRRNNGHDPSYTAKPRVDCDDYTLVPLVGEVGAGRGMIPLEGEPEAWLPVLANFSSNDMWAVRVGKRERSMMPVFHPEDIVLIDRTPVTAPQALEIYLVQEPPSEGSGYLLKRVKMLRQNIPMVMFYSDNVREGYQPDIHPLALYPDNAITNIIVGRAVHIWTDLRSRLG